MKDSLKIKISEKSQKIPINKIYHVNVKSMHVSTDIYRLFSDLIKINLSEKFSKDGYYIPEIDEKSVVHREVPLTQCHYRSNKKQDKKTYKSEEAFNSLPSKNL